MVYKFTKKDNSFFYLSFNTYQEAESFVSIVDGIQIEETFNLTKIPQNDILESDKSFLLFMMSRFVEMNRQASITSAEAAELLTAFNSIKQLSEVGAVPEVYGSIQALVTPIARVYTPQRQSEDLQKIAEYLATR